MAQTPYRPKSVFTGTLKLTENVVREIYSMQFSFVGSNETRMMELPDGQKKFQDWFSRSDTKRACDR